MQFSIPLIYDIVLALLVLLVALNGRRQGLLAGLMGLAGTVVGLIASVFATRRWADVLYNDYIGAEIGRRVEEAIAQNGGDAVTALQGMTFLPEEIRTRLAATLQDFGGDVVVQIVNALQPVIMPLIQVILFVVISFIVRWVFRLLAGWLRGFNNLPVLGTLNQILGFAFGFVTGLVDCWLACLLLWLVAAVTMGGIPALSNETLGGSYIYTFFARLNPFLVH